MRQARLSQVKTHPDLALFPIEKRDLKAITASMKQRGFDRAEPLIVWDRERLVVDGHTRLQAAHQAGLKQVCIDERPFEDFQAALDYAIARQRDRRNLSRKQLNAYIARVIQVSDRMAPGRPTKTPARAGVSASDTAEKLGVSTDTVERTRKVLADGDEEIKRQLLDGEIAPKPAYQAVVEAGKAKADSAPPLELTLKTVIPDLKFPVAYSVEQWNGLADNEKELVLTAAQDDDNSTFNKQNTEHIEWARWSWNPITGCLHNCPYCYARDIANRHYTQKFAPTFLPHRLSAPKHQRVPMEAAQDLGYRNVFTCSMADLFGKWVPEAWIEAVLNQARTNPQWNFLFLTKFPVRLAEFKFPDNAWLGTTVDCQARVKNAERSFAEVRGGIKWLSVEPLLEPLHFESLEMFDWIVIGGASASTQTPEWTPPRRWVLDLECQAARANCMIYEKTNLGIQASSPSRFREYPGVTAKMTTLPKSLAYLPSIEHSENVLGKA